MMIFASFMAEFSSMVDILLLDKGRDGTETQSGWFRINWEVTYVTCITCILVAMVTVSVALVTWRYLLTKDRTEHGFTHGERSITKEFGDPNATLDKGLQPHLGPHDNDKFKNGKDVAKIRLAIDFLNPWKNGVDIKSSQDCVYIKTNGDGDQGSAGNVVKGNENSFSESSAYSCAIGRIAELYAFKSMLADRFKNVQNALAMVDSMKASRKARPILGRKPYPGVEEKGQIGALNKHGDLQKPKTRRNVNNEEICNAKPNVSHKGSLVKDKLKNPEGVKLKENVNNAEDKIKKYRNPCCVDGRIPELNTIQSMIGDGSKMVQNLQAPVNSVKTRRSQTFSLADSPSADVSNKACSDQPADLKRQGTPSTLCKIVDDRESSQANGVFDAELQTDTMKSVFQVPVEVHRPFDDDVAPLENDGMNAALQMEEPKFEVPVKDHKAVDDNVTPLENDGMYAALQMEEPKFDVPVKVHTAVDDDILPREIEDMAAQLEKVKRFHTPVTVHLDGDTDDAVGGQHKADPKRADDKGNETINEDIKGSIGGSLKRGIADLDATKNTIDSNTKLAFTAQADSGKEQQAAKFQLGIPRILDGKAICTDSSEREKDFLNHSKLSSSEFSSKIVDDRTTMQDSLREQVFIKPPKDGGRPITIAEIRQLDYEDYLSEKNSAWKKFKNVMKPLKPTKLMNICKALKKRLKAPKVDKEPTVYDRDCTHSQTHNTEPLMDNEQ